jgi:hypothetical protein
MNWSWLKIVTYAGPVLIIITVVAYIADGWSAFPSALVAWGTILLAVTTWISVKSSNERENQRRVEEISRDRRQRDKDNLDDIKDWVLSIAKCNVINEYTYRTNIKDDETVRSYLKSEYLALSQRLDTSLADSLYLVRMASLYGEALHKAMLKVTGEINERLTIIKVCIECINKNDFSGFNVARDQLSRQNMRLVVGQDEVIVILVDLKFKLFNI